ncbi:MAG: hypothetical protein EAZ24_13450, partial [Burkholderiales bacterium]
MVGLDGQTSPPPPSKLDGMSVVAAPSVQPIIDGLAADLGLLDQKLRTTLDSDVALIRSIADYIVNAGGKRLRPIL